MATAKPRRTSKTTRATTRRTKQTTKRAAPRRTTAKRRTPPKQAPAAPPKPKPGSRLWVLDVPFATPRPPGAVYHRGLKKYLVDAPKLTAAQAAYAVGDYTLERWIQDDLNTSPTPRSARPEPMRPRKDQVTDAAKIVAADAAGQRQFLLTSQTGTGKTIVSVTAARQIADRRTGGKRPGRILVIANRPASICIPDFARTIAAAGDGGHRWLVTTVDRVHKVAKLKVDWDVVVTDEAHSFRNPDTRRTKARGRLTRQGNAQHTRVPFALDMTATPGHAPTELRYMSGLLAQRTGTKPADWVEDFLGMLEQEGFHLESGRYGKSWTEDPAEQRRDMARLRHLLERTPAVTAFRAAPWGPAPLDLAPVELDPARRAQYEQDWAEYIHEVGLARKVGANDKGRAAVLRWRQKALSLRIPDVAEWAAAQVEVGNQVVLHTDFIATGADLMVETLTEANIPTAHLFGNHDIAAELTRFASGAAPVAVTTMVASINLQAGAVGPDGKTATTTPRVGAMTAPLYSGIKGRQLLGRTHRNGQVGPWVIMSAANTVEEKVAATMVGRFLASDQMAGADTSTLGKVAQLMGLDWMPLEEIE